jgi:NAD(P)-dependent dehydrogenase (short-subunit alcohol dehydrogenase family)
MAGRVCMVTGANSGIGKETAAKLAEMHATVVMVCRSREKGEKAMVEIRRKSGSNSVELLVADLASLRSVRGIAKEFGEKYDVLHVLINNAGVARVRRSVTVDGYETTFQVNYLSPFLLTNLLLDSLKKSAPSRVVNVSSVSHFGGHMKMGDLQLKKGYGVMKAYGQSKLAQVLFTYELARRLEGTGVTVNCLHPGGVATNIWGNSLGPFAFMAKLVKLFLLSPVEGAETSVYLASSPEIEGVTGRYFEKKLEKRSAPDSYDVTLAGRVWDTSLSMVGLG